MQYTLTDLHRLVKQLRDPDHGCDWDKVQSFESLMPYTREEIYELLDAIEQQQAEAIQSELGDLLYHLIFYSELAKERYQFGWNEVIDHAYRKLIHRHPHLFSEQKDANDAVFLRWEEIKQRERNARSYESRLDDIPKSQPALMRAQKMQKRAATIGFDWPSIDPVLEKVQEELDEVTEAWKSDPNDRLHLQEEIGDLLFAAVNLARHAGFDAEETLHKAAEKFERRFRQVEQKRETLSQTKESIDLDQLTQLWDAVKKDENSF